MIFHSDLDNTLIYSYKRNIGADKKCVEWYQGREVSYITTRTEEYLLKVKERCCLVPTTTRTIEQYQRIQLGIGIPEYALVCNGGILLHHGVEDTAWYRESLELIRDSREMLIRAEQLMRQDEHRSMEVRNINDLFLFTKSSQPEQTVSMLASCLDLNLVDVFHNGIKVYVLPKKLSKGMAVRRLRQKLQPSLVYAAGDSEFDVSMLREADFGMAPESLAAKLGEGIGNVKVFSEEAIFSENVLETLMSVLSADSLSGV